jgi:integrase/recombinase XerD
MSHKRPANELAPIPRVPGGISTVRPAVEAGKAFLSANTKRAYFCDWKDFFEVEDLALVTPAMALAVTPERVADFRDRCLERGLGPGTVVRKLSSVRAFFDQMILRGVITINPAHPKLVRSPKRGTVRKMEALSADEARRFLSVIDRTTPGGRRDYAVIMIDLHMGLRRSEAMSIMIDQFKTAEGVAYIVFRGKGEKERMVTVNEDLSVALRAYSKDRGNEPGWLFPGKTAGKHLSGDQFWRIVQKYLDIAGIRKKVGTHGLRATFITHNLLAGTPLHEVQRTVGHSRGETTLGYARDLEMIKSRAPAAMEGIRADDTPEEKKKKR